MKVYVPRDAAARALGADAVAEAICAEAARRGVAVTLVRNGSRGMVWLEPLVEVETDGGRHGLRADDARRTCRRCSADLAAHPKALGPDRGHCPGSRARPG